MSAPSTPSLLTRLLLPPIIVAAAVAISLFFYTDAIVQNLYFDTLSDEVLHQAKLVGAELDWTSQGAELDRQCAHIARLISARVTVIAADGTVLGDSDTPSASLENHRDRPEVRGALRDGIGRDARLSTSVKQRLFYQAWKDTRGEQTRVIRFAIAMTRVELARSRIRTSLASGLALAIIVALWPVWRITRRIALRLGEITEFSTAVASGSVPPRIKPGGSDVLGQLETNVVAMADGLRQQLQRAQAEKNKLEATLGGMVEGVLVIDRDGTVRLSNQRCDRLLGDGQQSLIGRPLITINRDPELHELVRSVLALHSGAPISREITLHQPEALSLRVTASPIASEAGTPALYILVFHDITELKKLEVTRRDFVANVSHELRTPLTAIRGYAETLMQGAIADPELAKRFVGVIERHSERLSRLTDDLLILSDLELGRAALHREALRLDNAIAGAIDVVHDKAAQKGVELTHELPSDLPEALADADRIEQVLVNLLDNAVKYTPAGGRVRVSARRLGAGEVAVDDDEPVGEWIEIAVADTGVGVPSQDLPRLTERFYRVDKARSRELGGTGLGLAIVKHIIQLHGGTLQIESELGKGTTVRVTLPATA